ncbi:MAG: hypothetical protein ABI873_03755 [Marmoricola sp.]
MSDSDEAASEELTPEQRAERHRRLARIFGDVLPEQTSDDRAEEPAGPVTEDSEAWLRAQVPPHHG